MDEFLKAVKELEGIATLIAVLGYSVYKFYEKKKQAILDAKKKIEEDAKRELEAKNHSPEFTIDLTREVKHEARKIRDRHGAMRVFVIEFSNGSVTESGLPLLKVSFKYEVVLDYGVQVERISELYQEIPMPEMFLTPMNVVFKTGEFYNKDINNLNLTDAHQRDYYDWLKAYGIGSSMWLALHKKSKPKPVAILVIHWPRPTDLDGTIIARIKDIKRNIEKVYEKIKEV